MVERQVEDAGGDAVRARAQSNETARKAALTLGPTLEGLDGRSPMRIWEKGLEGPA